jgi:hypothetical protein
MTHMIPTLKAPALLQLGAQPSPKRGAFEIKIFRRFLLVFLIESFNHYIQLIRFGRWPREVYSLHDK